MKSSEGRRIAMSSSRAKIALIAMPWHDPYFPSIQLGALKSYVEREIPSLSVDLFHFYFTLEEVVGFDISQAISHESGLIAEAIFAYHLFPEKQADIRSFLAEEKPRLT